MRCRWCIWGVPPQTPRVGGSRGSPGGAGGIPPMNCGPVIHSTCIARTTDHVDALQVVHLGGSPQTPRVGSLRGVSGSPGGLGFPRGVWGSPGGSGGIPPMNCGPVIDSTCIARTTDQVDALQVVHLGGSPPNPPCRIPGGSRVPPGVWGSPGVWGDTPHELRTRHPLDVHCQNHGSGGVRVVADADAHAAEECRGGFHSGQRLNRHSSLACGLTKCPRRLAG